ncbi:MAG TPA: ATP-binding cassette domain-containing protein, partial [Actinomycetota bacterium]|nr:ATP-binding cassette domain-containing protein [Actinomycetota bacterium]
AYGDRQVLNHLEWRLAPGERTGILGVNGAGKSTLLNVIAGSQEPTSGEVRRGKTVKVGRLTQEPAGLGDGGAEPVRQLLKGARSTYVSGGRELSPAQLLERLGFTNAHLSTAVRELSGGQQRRLQFLLLLLGEPNVLLLDEPSNDLDTDMLAVVEDLLDSWPGTLIVVSHDRYFLERVTDQQYAVIGGRLRHLPGGVDEYLRLVEAPGAHPAPGAQPAPTIPPLAGNPGRQARREEVAALRAATKELAAVDRKLVKLPEEIAEVNRRLAEHDPSDYAGLLPLLESLRTLTEQQAELETRWLELHEQIEAGSRP